MPAYEKNSPFLYSAILRCSMGWPTYFWHQISPRFVCPVNVTRARVQSPWTLVHSIKVGSPLALEYASHRTAHRDTVNGRWLRRCGIQVRRNAVSPLASWSKPVPSTDLLLSLPTSILAGYAGAETWGSRWPNAQPVPRSY